MKNLKSIKVVLLTITLFVLLSLGGQVFASDTIQLVSPDNNTTSNNTSGNKTTNNTVAPNSIKTTTNKTNSSSYNNTNLPKTGAEDYTAVYIILGVCAISAIYAYKKVKQYKGIE